MDKALKESRDLFERVRFSGENILFSEAHNQFNNLDLDDFFVNTDLPLTEELTPELFFSVKEVCQRLNIPVRVVKPFIYASPKIQAQCYSGNEMECILRISSGLIQILDLDELQFIIGHELGHFLYRHGIVNANIGDTSREFFMQRRSQEISVDRVGYLASKSLDIAMKALMKTISGLSSEYLRFDISSYISHLDTPSDSVFNASQSSTHPSILFRCRALLWFSMKVDKIEDLSTLDEKEINKLDQKILKDLERYVDGPSKELIKQAKLKVEMWNFMSEVIKDHTFNKKEQKVFADRFGKDKLLKMTKLLNESSVNEAIDLVEAKLDRAKSDLKLLIPFSYNNVIKLIEEKAVFE